MTTTLRTAAMLLALTAGCQEELDPASLIDRDRPLGARVEVEGAPTQAWPAPGERAVVRWYMQAPGPVGTRTWSFVVCPSMKSPDGSSDFCVGTPFAVLEGSGLVPEVAFEVPTATALDGVTRIALIGVICTDGAVVIEPGAVGCREGTATTNLVSLEIQLAMTATNRNPTLADNLVLFDGAPWPETTSPRSGCVDVAEIPKVGAGDDDDSTESDEHVVAITTDDADRDSYVRAEGDPPVKVDALEQLQLSRFTTAGELDRQFGVVEGDLAGVVALETAWTPPPASEVPPGGLLVHLTFVVRDLRGGVDAITRQVCITSP